MLLPTKFLEENLKAAKGMLIFGVLLEEMSRDELIAVAAAGFKAEALAKEEGHRRLDVMQGLK